LALVVNSAAHVFIQETAGKQLFLVTDMAELDRQPGLKAQ
jgi:hypothetical protein